MPLHPSLEPVLARTLGVPLFQEQLLRMAMVAAGFTGGQAEELRRAMGFKRSEKRMQQIEVQLREGMAAGTASPARPPSASSPSITSFALYGFPESHAASFALLAYASAYLKVHYPAAFYTALLNNQPMGFYHPATLVKDAQRRGVRFHPIDVQQSDWLCRVEADGGIRLGFMYVNGLRKEMGQAMAAFDRTRTGGTAAAVREVRVRRRVDDRDRAGRDGPRERRRGSTTATSARTSGRCSSSRSAASRRSRTSCSAPACAATSWRRWPTSARSTRSPTSGAARCGRWSAPCARPGSCFEAQMHEPGRIGNRSKTANRHESTTVTRCAMDADERLHADYAGMGLTIGPHPMALRRSELALRGVLRAVDLPRARDGRRVRVAGMVITRQRPGTAKGFVFLTLEDETGISNIIVRPDLFDRERLIVVRQPFLIVDGVLQHQDGVLSVRAERFEAIEGAASVEAHDFY